MTTSKAAELAHCSIQNIQAHIHHGNLPAHKVGRDWHIERRDFDRWLASPRRAGYPAGRPRKQKQIDLPIPGKEKGECPEVYKTTDRKSKRWRT